MIRSATIDDLQAAGAVVARFSADIGRVFHVEHFCGFWGALIDAGYGSIFLLEQEGVIQGLIGGLATPDPYHGGMVASEAFWWVLPEYRGGIGAGRLYKAFETWAVEQCAEEIRMVHLEASMPERLAKFYERNGYTLMETHYSKPLQKLERRAA
tara:strand:+ start:315 stop:776 length:462 start_codon:yes stop_codon:yes gene_type:complete